MSETLFTIITASVALLGTMLWLTAIMLFSIKYFEYRMKEREKEKTKGGDEADSVKDTVQERV